MLSFGAQYTCKLYIAATAAAGNEFINHHKKVAARSRQSSEAQVLQSLFHSSVNHILFPVPFLVVLLSFPHLVPFSAMA